MDKYQLEDLINQFSGHAWEFGMSHPKDFNLPLAMQNIVEELRDAKNKILEMQIVIDNLQIYVNALRKWKIIIEDENLKKLLASCAKPITIPTDVPFSDGS
jgi:hypothetical protein